MPMQTAFFSKTVEQTVLALKTDLQNGLSGAEVAKRQLEFGPNKLTEKKGKTVWDMFLAQFQDAVVWILIVAAAISGISGFISGAGEDFLEAAVILVLVAINAVLGVRQEFKAEKAMLALAKLAGSKARVIRNGSEQQINAVDLVPGDIVLVEGGDKIPADLRLIQSINLKIDEASLTGESQAVAKNTDALAKNTALGDQKNLAFMNTQATYGRGIGIVIGTGVHTEFGKIANMIQTIEQEKTPLAQKMEVLGGQLAKIVIVIAILILALEIGELLIAHNWVLADIALHEFLEILLIAVALAVAAVPEGLPAVVTITLSNGMGVMAKHNAIIRKMAAVETLGSTNVICTDKTGTLTKNEMVVRTVLVDDQLFSVTGSGYEIAGEIKIGEKKAVTDSQEWQRLLENCFLCNNSHVDAKTKTWLGDPTEICLKVLAHKDDVPIERFKTDYRFVSEVPFESERKRMSVVYEKNGKNQAYCKGSCESVLATSLFELQNDKITPLTEQRRQYWLSKNDELASQGLRVLGFAFKELKANEKNKNELNPEFIESNLIFLGLIGMIDASREGVKEAIRECNDAGIEVKMITGDHKLTAMAIAREIGLWKENSIAVTGPELCAMSDSELDSKIDSIAVMARVSPSDKMRIVSILQKKGKVVAMTGDGINDAPALKKADIGIAMGITGTDVSKEASAMIIQDDHFATIVHAIKEGRRVYDNIKSFVTYLLSANTAEVLLITVAILIGWPVPLLPFHLLWLNLLTDGFPALALGNEKAAKDVMKKKPRPKTEKITDKILPYIVIAGIVGMLVTLYAFSVGYSQGSVEKGRTMAFAALILFELVWVFSCKNPSRTVFNSNPFDNQSLNLAVIASLVLLVLAIHLPVFNALLQTVPLEINDWLLVVLLALPATLLEAGYLEIKKRFGRQAVNIAAA